MQLRQMKDNLDNLMITSLNFLRNCFLNFVCESYVVDSFDDLDPILTGEAA